MRSSTSTAGGCPADVAALEALPGVGPYTARAVAAIAFGLPVGAVDTNVRRVLGRIVAGGAEDPGAGELQALADAVVPRGSAGDWTHAADGSRRDGLPAAHAPTAAPARRGPWCRFATALRMRRGRRRARRPAARHRDERRPRSRPRRAGSAAGSWIGCATRRTATGSRSTRRSARTTAPRSQRARGALARDGLVELDGASAGAEPSAPVWHDCRRGRRVAASRRLRFAWRCPPTVRRSSARRPPLPLPADDPAIFELDLRGLRRRLGGARRRCPPISAETMTGADRRAQALGMPEVRLMEHAGTAVAAAVRALAADLDRWGTGPIVILCGPGNNGGDGYVAARRLALAGAPVIVAVVAAEARPTGAVGGPELGPDRPRHGHHQGPPAGRPRRGDVRPGHRQGRGRRRRAARHRRSRRPARADPLGGRGHRPGAAAGVPVVAVDTPTAVDLSSGEPSDPAVRADLTVTFHRPKTGLLTRRGAAHAGKVLVAPIGIPPEADRG